MTDPAQQPLVRALAPPPWRILLVAVLGFWAARLAVVLSQGDVFGYEEFAKAALGRAMFDDLGVEHYRLAYHYYELGGFLFSHLDALFFALFGSSVLVVKLVAIAWHTALLVVVLLLAHSAFGRRGAAIAALIFVLPPESLQKLSLLALGIHLEALLFHAWILLHAGRIALDGVARRRDFLGLGLACGLGIAVNLTTLAAVLCAGLAVLIHARSSLGRGRWAWLLGGALCGLLPWLWMAANVGGSILNLHGERLGAGRTWPQVFARLSAFVVGLLSDRSALDLADFLVRTLLFLWGVTLVVRGLGSERSWARLLLAHLLIFCGAYVYSRMGVGRIVHYNEFSRPAPAWLPVGLLSAGGLAHALGSRSALRTALARVGVVALALFGLRSLGLAMGPVPVSRWGESCAALASTSGCAYMQSIAELYKHLDGTMSERIAVMLKMSEPDRRRLEAQVGSVAIAREAANLDEGLAMARQIGGERWDNFAVGLGELVVREADRDISRVPEVLARFDPEEQRVLFEAGARRPKQHHSVLSVVLQDIEAARQARLPEPWFEGLGWLLAQVHIVDARCPYHRLEPIHPGYDLQAGREILAAQPEDVRPALERGWLRAVQEQKRERR